MLLMTCCPKTLSVIQSHSWHHHDDVDVRCFISQFVSDSTGNSSTNTTGNPEEGGPFLALLSLLQDQKEHFEVPKQFV